MKRLIFILSFLLAFLPATLAHAKTLRIAIIDTGLNLNDQRFNGHLCSEGHKDFTNTSLEDINGHGTFVTSLIQKYAGNGNYCFLIYKYYSSDTIFGLVNLTHEIQALREAIANKVDIVNFSGGGEIFSEEESLLIKYNPKITFVVAAGNDNKNLDLAGNYFYPASYFYGNEEVVGSIDYKNKKTLSSNYSKKIIDKEIGDNVYSYLPNGKMGYMSGSSMSTAIFTGKLIRKTLDASQ